MSKLDQEDVLKALLSVSKVLDPSKSADKLGDFDLFPTLLKGTDTLSMLANPTDNSVHPAMPTGGFSTRRCA
ncbi:hypothetical protein COO91_02915 [Nostoc flagelliforme CCNUN1]|uniref:Uncharacterized protein n=1 Tax=Nostoc flagelliforme CCNUN1 TaxID=2038116 RepID=A0A2K8SNE2_9NOSO|nr:hypothetical protein COO91_02915 [Nostoc flagelliforme CCNUN1]